MSITCFIRYEIDPFRRELFERYARDCDAIPRRGANLVGHFAPHEGSATTGYGVHSLDSLAAHEAYRARRDADPLGRETYEFDPRKRFVPCEDRIFLKRVPDRREGERR